MISYLSKGLYDKSVSYQPIPDNDHVDNFIDVDDYSKSTSRFSPQNVKCKNEEIYVLNIKSDQTIQSIALKYNCSLWELNRLNNLITSQDFYSLKEIKIPSTQNSYRSELLKADGAQLLSEKLLNENGVIVEEPSMDNSNVLEFNQMDSNDNRNNKSAIDLILGTPTFNVKEFVENHSVKKSLNLICGLKLTQILCILFFCLIAIPAIIVVSILVAR